MVSDDSDSTKACKRSNTIMTQIAQLEDSLKKSLHRVELIERKLNTKLLTQEDRELLEHELEEVREVLKKNEDQLKQLRTKNMKSFVMTALLLFLCFLIYGFYDKIFNTR